MARFLSTKEFAIFYHTNVIPASGKEKPEKRKIFFKNI
jgi:hypothetical protein